MTKTKHTPGPWFLPHFANPDVNCQCRYIIAEHGGMGGIAEVLCSGDGDNWVEHGDNPKFEEAVANARLIAAAPKLLEHLIALVEVLDAFGITGSNLEEARAEIAAALGDVTQEGGE